MPAAVRVARVFILLLDNNDRIGIPIQFGVGRKDRAVELLGAHYFASGISTSPVTSRLGGALSENPAHEGLNAPPTLTFAFHDAALYALSAHWTITVGAAFSTAIRLPYVPLYGLLVPFRQIVCLFNNGGTSMKMRAEIYYRPTDLPDTDLDSINRQKGAYRRT